MDLATQLLLLLTVFAGGGLSNAVISEELKTEAYKALAALFQSLKSAPKGPGSLVEESTIPALGHCLTTILEGITDGPTPECQLAAIEALRSLCACVKDQQALSTFLPGTVSSLTKALMPSIKAPRARKVLVAALNALQEVIVLSLGDIRTRNLPEADSDTIGQPARLTKSWLKATASQIKLALANIVKLSRHESHDVRSALSRVCLVLLDECHESLEEAGSLLVETVMSNSGRDLQAEEFGQTGLRDLAIIHDSILELIKTTVYKWVTSFPRVMQANDESAKTTAMNQLAEAYKLMSDLSMDSEVLEDAIADSLRDGVTSIISLTSQKNIIEESVPLRFDGSVILARDVVSAADFRPVIMPQQSQVQVRSQFQQLLESFGSAEAVLRMATKILPRGTTDNHNLVVSSFWLSFQMLKASTMKSKDIDDFLMPSLSTVDDQEQVLEELYESSLSFLSEEDNTTWELQAVALEVIAYQANYLKEDFKSELIDVLYPVVQLLGSPKTQLRGHAITCLNLIAVSCNYTSTSELVVDNVDYLVNAVALRLNTFDITPQTPQVLVMMIKLSGPSLLPYLDDTVSSIFAALENFHGYPRLVETLFSVLSEIVDQGGKSGQLRPTAGDTKDHRKRPPEPPSMEDIIKAVKKRKAADDPNEDIAHEDFPREPWKTAKELLDEHDARTQEKDPDNEMKDAEPEPEQSQEITTPPPTKVYTMVQSIARLGQHYLTSQSPLLRRRLLELISTACIALNGNEDQFLPLINDIWPVIIKRLYDEESFVVIAACTTISEICRGAGDFMATRIQSEWIELSKKLKQAKMKAAAEKKGKHARGIYAVDSQVWEAFVGLLVAVVENVRLTDEIFDEVLEFLGDLLTSRKDVHDALSVVNADAVWLEEVKRGKDIGPPPVVDGVVFPTSLE